MQTLAIISSKSIWLFNVADMNPKGLRLFPNLSDALRDIYDFDEQADDAQKAPTSADSGMKLVNGQFETEDGAVRVNLEIYNDGLVADTLVSTAITDRFLAHALDWASKAFGVRFDPSLIVKRIYTSEVVVRFSDQLASRLESLSQFSKVLSQSGSASQPQIYGLAGLTFISEDGTSTFAIERRANSPVGANVFYSRAPMATNTHLAMLEQFELLNMP